MNKSFSKLRLLSLPRIAVGAAALLFAACGKEGDPSCKEGEYLVNNGLSCCPVGKTYQNGLCLDPPPLSFFASYEADGGDRFNVLLTVWCQPDGVGFVLADMEQPIMGSCSGSTFDGSGSSTMDVSDPCGPSSDSTTIKLTWTDDSITGTVTSVSSYKFKNEQNACETSTRVTTGKVTGGTRLRSR